MGRTAIVKERFSKKYRHPSLDSKLTLRRLTAVSSLNKFSASMFSMPPGMLECNVKFLLASFKDKFLMQEARCMTKARRLGVYTPVLYALDPVLHTLTFEYVEGPAVKDVLLDFGLNGVIDEQMENFTTQIGKAIAKIHDGGLIHGDLTTSNMLLRTDTNQLVRNQILSSISPPAFQAHRNLTLSCLKLLSGSN